MLKALRFVGLLTLSLAFWSSQQAVASPWKGEYKYEYKADKHGYKHKRKHKGGAYHAGGPPPWAPAHGYRWQRGGGYRGGVQTAYVPPFDLDLGRCNRTAVGALLGGAAGGALGSTVGSGDERTAAIIGGTVLGVLVGGSIGHYMDQVDQSCVGQILEHAPDGEAIVWNTPETGSRHEVTPVSTYQDTGGRYCREYQAVSVIADQPQQTYGTACRQPDGSWQLAN